MNSVARRFGLSPCLWVLFITCRIAVGMLPASAQQSTPGTSTQTQSENTSFHRTWQIGAYGSGGYALDYHVGCLCIFRYRKEQEFYTVTFEAGRMLTASHGPRLLKGRVEALAEITPFWLTHSPAQENIVYSNEPFFNGAKAGFAPYTQHGLSFTPLLFRWNFTNHNSNRHIPWLQAGAGVLWTNKRFPQGDGYAGTNTSIFNFTPQVGVGENLFVKKNQSLNVGMRVIQYNNAGLGEFNPGVPYTLNFSVGYSWWK
jgi:lipid A 3-O-deacylase